MDGEAYKAAYERQKVARERAENLLEDRSRELYESNTALKTAYEKLKNQKSQLLHQEKLASIGQLSAGIAHEINNPAGFVKSNLSSLQNYMADILKLLESYSSLTNALSNDVSAPLPQVIISVLDRVREEEESADIDFLVEDIPNLIGESLDGTNRITKIVNGLKVFSRIDSDEKEPFDVNECIENTIKLVQNEIKYKAELTQDLNELPKTMGYPGGLSQVVLNMLVNASHAIEDFGEINVKTFCADDWIVIQIRDNGSGMPQETIDKIFDPFYTTKEVGVGTGLGLSISAGIIKQHDGNIDVDSTLGEGTCFTLQIPIIAISD